MLIKLVENVFDKKSVKVIDVDYKYQTVKDYFLSVTDYNPDDFIPAVNGGRVNWDYIPSRDDEVIFINDIKGGGGGGLLGVITGGALIGLSFVPGLQGVAPYLMTAGISMLAGSVVGYVAEKLFAPNLPDRPDYSGFSNSKTYSWDGIQNIVGEGNVVPVVYGKHRVGGVVIEAFTSGDTVNGIQEKKYLNVLLALSEGEIEGDLSDDKIFINKNPITNFEGITWDFRKGTAIQEPIANFSKIAKQYNISGVQLKYNSPYVYKTNNRVDSVKLTIAFSSLFQLDDDGNIKNLSCVFSVEYKRIDDASYVSLGEYTVTNATKSMVEYDIYFTLPGRDEYYIRITRKTEDFDNDTRKNAVSYFKSVTEYQNTEIGYINTALLGLRIEATDKLSGFMPAITATVKGVKIKDVRTGLYSWNNNPANILYDLLTNKRYGLGLDEGQIDIESFKEFADWCDESVSYSFYDPSTGSYITKTEKRYEINLVVDKEFNAIDLIGKICASCRALPYWQGNKFKVVIERPSSPVQLFSMGNIVSDSFEENYVNLKDIPNQVDVQFLDEDNEYEQTIITVFDKSRLDEPVNSKTIQLYGITKKSVAKREAIFALKKAKAIRKFIKFEAGLDAVICEAGDVILFQHDTTQYGYGGRIKEVLSDRVILDRTVPLEQGKQYTLRVRKSDNTFEVFTVLAEATIETDEIKINMQSTAQAGDVYAFGEVNKEAKPYRILSIAKKTDKTVEIHAEEYNESIFNEDDSIEIEETKYSQLGLTETYELDGTADEPQPIKLADNPRVSVSYYDIPPYVLDVTLTEKVELINEQVVSSIIVDFATVKMPENSLSRIDRYEILHSTDGANWEVVGFCRGGFFELRNVEIGIRHYILVKPYTIYGVTNDIEKSQYKLKFDIVPTGQVAVPDDISNFVAVQNGDQIIFEWDDVTNTPVKYYEIRQGDWALGKRLITTKLSKASVFATTNGWIDFYIKAVNINGVYSENPARYSLYVNSFESGNLIYTKDDRADGWDGDKENFFVNVEGDLELQQGAGKGQYITGYIDLLEQATAKILIDYAVKGEIGNEKTWDEMDVIWDEALEVYESLVDVGNIDYRHEISLFTGLSDDYVNIVRLSNSTAPLLDNGTVAVSNEANVTYEFCTFHHGVKKDFKSVLDYSVQVPDIYGILFRFKVLFLTHNGVICEFIGSGNKLSVVLLQDGRLWLFDGVDFIENRLQISENDKLLIGFSNMVNSSEFLFFTGNVSTKEYAVNRGILNFIKPITISVN
ncbi:host specificity factor TipJ family phage tail protein [Deferribacter abyssi]|uniref:host specificity factor TipJ family phage tail protein n=1 Tax=Deferribacter abyssi TaxID=213806 RepID=UPI003C143B4A